MRSRAVLLLAILVLAQSARGDECSQLIEEGFALHHKREYKAGLDCFERALKANPKSAQAQAYIGMALRRLDRPDDAIVAYEKAIALEPSPGRWASRSQAEIGLIWGDKGDFERALVELKKALVISPTDAIVWRFMGQAYSELKLWKDAADSWEKSLASSPNQPQLKQWIAEARQKAGLSPSPEASAKKLGPLAAGGDASFELPDVGAWVTTPDLKKLVVAVPSRGELVFYDTMKLAEQKRVVLDFKPARLALQGKLLLATTVGGSTVYVLDLETGKSQKAIKVPGDPLVDIACHHAKGNVFVSNAKEEILSIDPRSGAVSKTEAKGHYLAVDPQAGAFLYTCSAPEGFAAHAVLRKYGVKGKDLAPLATNKNGPQRASALHVSPDGKKVLVVGSESAVEVWSADDAVTPLGQIESLQQPESVVFHPVLGLGAGLGAEGNLVQFQGRSLAQVRATKVEGARTSGREGGVLTFVGHGEKVAVWRPGDPAAKESGRLYFYPLELTKEDLAALDKALGAR